MAAAAFKVEKYSDDQLREIAETIDRELKERKNKERKEIARQFHELATKIGLTPDEVLAEAPKTRKRPPAAPKYKDPETGKTWAGRGRKPRWLEDALASGKQLEDFAI